MLTWVFIFLGAVGLTAVLILIGLAIATLEEICKREVTNKMRWRDPDPGRDGRSVEHGKEIKRDFMSTYDNGSEISNAVETLVRAATVGRRR